MPAAYRMEGDFVRAFMNCCRGTGYVFLTRIESRTVLGIPDMFYAYDRVTGWIEFKVIDQCLQDCKEVYVPFRPGQQMWAKQYKIASKRAVMLLVAFIDGMFVAPMNTIYTHGIYPPELFRYVCPCPLPWDLKFETVLEAFMKGG